MPVFYFNICHCGEPLDDDEGMNFQTVEVALAEGREAAFDLLVEDIRARRAVGDKTLEVRDGDGLLAGAFRLKDLVV
jgi:hypothetical protein